MVDELRLLRQLLEADPLPDDPGLTEAIKARLEAEVGAATAPSASQRALLAPLTRAGPVVLRQVHARRRRELVCSVPLSPPSSDGEALGRWRDRPRRRLALGSLTVAVAVGAVALAASLAVPAGVTPPLRWALAGAISTSWTQVPGHAPSGFLTCPSTTTCYASGPRSVEVTRDGGETWHAAPTNGGTPLTNVACSRAADCAFVEVGASGKPVFFETADGGRTWASRRGPAKLAYTYQLKKGSVEKEGPIDLSCPSASTCTVVASALFQFGAFVTEDGGRTWSAASMPSPSYQVQCFPDARCVSGAEEGANYSTDNGLEWSPAWTPGDTLQMLSCSNSQTCMAVSPPGGGAGVALVVSDNGGESWSAVEAQGLPAGKVFTGLACPTASECWMSGFTLRHVGRGGLAFVGAVLLSSTNGGRGWQGTGLPKGITGVYAISCPRPTTCFAVASKGPAVHSSGGPAVPPTFVLLAYTAARQ